jgi:Lrp/AsnC family leucine-responsive transcriptional regulator
MPASRRTSAAKTFSVVSPLLDEINLGILRELLADPRLPTATLARRLGMSAPAVSERVHRLWEAGVITGCTLELDPRALGRPVTAYVRMRPAPGQVARVAELAKRNEAVVECHRITGEDCFLIKICVPDIASIEGVLDQFLRYGPTTTSIVQSTPVPLRAVPLPAR